MYHLIIPEINFSAKNQRKETLKIIWDAFMEVEILNPFDSFEDYLHYTSPPL